ncbi:hypothetical protein [Natrinema longum]|uniref:Uncharacterized protein n=1 Tax=Natrinema longum TaxID=370324 RepID=A0A8A2UC38_9EURY|nr:hypothetical protein [Natrinema longum]MBZ6496006.1 hypothetical protein [Natrinema longum]QSW86062.1 hypothetical protein J0X27_04310 [Natrinema longum]
MSRDDPTDDTLFAGVDDINQSERSCSSDDRDGLEGTDYVNPIKWARHLEYDEIHSFTVGFAPAFLAIVLGEPTFLFLTTLVVAGAFFPWLLRKRLRYCPREPHYCVGGSVLGVLAAVPTGVLLDVFGVLPA